MIQNKLILIAFLACCLIPTMSRVGLANTNDLSEGQDLLFSSELTPDKQESNFTSPPMVIGDSFAPINTEEQVDLQADQVEYDDNNKIVSAFGGVELVQAGRIVRADKMTYNLTNDKVIADGNVIMNEITGDVFFADKVELQDKMKDGFIQGLSGILTDGSRFTAEQAEKIADLKVIMSKATYTACEPCKANPERAPIWQIKARNVTHHKDEARISYNDATFEVAGVPVLYSPYFSHPDGTIKRKSGLLTPRLGFDSSLGANYKQEYYWDIAPDKDATVGLTAFSSESPLASAEYRQRFKNASIKTTGSVTHSGRTDSISGEDVGVKAETRGHFFADGLWDINDKWRAGTELKLVSDEQFLRQYNITNDDILENKIYAERFSNRDYATARIINFRDIRVSERRVDQPYVLPELYAKFIGAPNQTLGGRWSLETSFLGLQREGNDQDVNRATVKGGWQRRLVTDFGLVNTLDLTARGDTYKINDRDVASTINQRSEESSAARGFVQGNYQTSFPVAKDLDMGQLVLEPLASIKTGTDLNVSDDIPNEDSQDVFLDMTNLFNANRFPGYDRIEDKTSATYGLRTGLFTNNGYHGEVFFGQSYRFHNDDNPFPDGSGLSDQKSDYVGNVSISAGENLNLNYAMQLDDKNLSSQRHEIDASTKIGDTSLHTRYFFANGLQGTDLNKSREQINVGGRYDINEQWGVLGSMQYDFAKESEGMRYASYGIDYQGQCVSIMLTGQRRLTRDSAGDSNTEIFLRIGLKNLGEFQTSGVTINSEEN